MENYFKKFMNIFKMDNNKKRNNTASNSHLTNMQDTHVSFGEDPGSLEDLEDEK